MPSTSLVSTTSSAGHIQANQQQPSTAREQPVADPLAIHMPPPVEKGLPVLRLDPFARLPREAMTDFLAPKLKLEERLTFGTTSKPIGEVMDEAAIGDPAVAHYYAQRHEPARKAEFVARRRAIAAKAPTTESLRNYFRMWERDMARPYEPTFGVVAGVFLHLKQPMEAKRILERCSAVFPDNDRRLTQMAQTYWQLGECDLAIAIARTTGRVGSKFLTCALLARGDIAGALEAAAQDPDCDFLAKLSAQARTDPIGAFHKVIERSEADGRVGFRQDHLREAAVIGQAELVFDRLDAFAADYLFTSWNVLNELSSPIYDAYRAHPRFQEVVDSLTPSPAVLRTVTLTFPPGFFGVDRPPIFGATQPAEGKSD